MNPMHDYDDELFLMEMELDELIECNKSCNETDDDLIDTDDFDGIDDSDDLLDD